MMAGHRSSFSTARINGEIVFVDEEIKKSTRSEVPNILKRLEELKADRTAGWTCAIGLEIITRAVVENSGAVISCSVVLDGKYGLKGLNMPVPVKLGKEGVAESSSRRRKWKNCPSCGCHA